MSGVLEGRRLSGWRASLDLITTLTNTDLLGVLWAPHTVQVEARDIGFTILFSEENIPCWEYTFLPATGILQLSSILFFSSYSLQLWSVDFLSLALSYASGRSCNFATCLAKSPVMLMVETFKWPEVLNSDKLQLQPLSCPKLLCLTLKPDLCDSVLFAFSPHL